MPLNLRELREWPPEIADLAGSTRQAAANHTNSADFYRSLAKASTWEGDGGDAARVAMVSSAGQHEAVAENLGKAATGMEHAQHDAEGVAQKIKSILDYAAQQPAVQVNEATNQVIPPDTSYLDDEAAAKVAAKVTDLQAQIAAVLADGERVDGELAGAIGTATGTTPPVKKTASSLEDLLMPGSGERKPPPRPDDGTKQPDSLDSALDQLAGKPGDRPPTPGGQAGADPATGSVPLDPKKVEQFKALARQTMLNDGVPPDQIEQRLNAMVAAAQKPQPAYTPPKPDKMPPPSFKDGFADGWFGTEEGIRDLVGANGWDDLKKSWTDMAKGAWDRITNPVESWTEEVEHATKYPAHYFGEKAGETALTAPGAMFGGEGALAARAGALDDLTRVGAIPHGLIDNPTAAGTFEHHTPTPLGDLPSHHGAPTLVPDAPPLPPDHPMFDGYDPIPPGPEFTHPDGGLIYPDASLPTKPYAIPGTVIDNAQIPQGTVIDRFGSPFGSWLSPDGTPFPERALPPDSATKSYYQYAVDDPTKLPAGFRIEQSQVAPWFHQPGGGIQYRIIGPDGNDASVNDLLDSGYLKDLHE
ncbi:hypothetical protein J3E61_002869 [Mycobacterium sp. OAE908]|uniref:TNT domain-containing protein n=1 Tax=Mycobacterium sp. OAE908 TaxID=2817899 RepID=UPI0034E1A3FD